MSQNLQNFAKFQKFQLDNLVDFEKCCKTRIFLQKSMPIQPKTSNILPKICQKLATNLQLINGEVVRAHELPGGAGPGPREAGGRAQNRLISQKSVKKSAILVQLRHIFFFEDKDMLAF